MIKGRIFKSGAWWAAEAPDAGVFTQGRSRADAKAMLADAFESLINRPGFKVTVADFGDGDDVLVEANEAAPLAAYVLKHQREIHGLSLANVAEALGASSRTAYSRYEQGASVPTLDKFQELLRAVAPDMTVIFVPRMPPRSRGSKVAAKAGRATERHRSSKGS
jgi:hypothetical protein